MKIVGNNERNFGFDKIAYNVESLKVHGYASFYT